MSFLDKVAKSVASNFITITEPTFMKEFTKESNQLNDLIELSKKLKDGDKKDHIERDIIWLKTGIAGENNVYYEIKNSFIPLICLHDIRLEYKDYVSQYDFIIITNKFICVLETKKLFGNISINRDGDFIRTLKNRNGKSYKEGMYSPISQNERHLRILKEILVNNNVIRYMPLKSLVVMANEKTIIDKRRCPSHISKALYKYDQIVPYLKRNLNDKKNDMNVSGKNMVRIAKFLLKNDKPIKFDYLAKYGIVQEDYLDKTYDIKSKVKKIVIKEKSIDNEQIRNKLKKYRLNKSRQEKVKPYYIFTNKQMEELINNNPKSVEDILSLNGFGKLKVQKYGKDILDIFTKRF